jgi:putative ABC transport system permease protein
MRPRWRKVIHDLVDNKMRTLLVVFSIAIGVFSIGVIAGAYAIISNDMSASFAANNPMNVEVRTGYFTDDLIDTIKSMNGIAEAEGRNIFTIRVRTPGSIKWMKFNFVAVDNYKESTINLLRKISGESEPGKGQLLLEKKATTKINAPIGSDLEIQLEDGSIKKLKVTGIVQDQTTSAGDFLAAPFAYISMDSLVSLHQPDEFNRLFVVATDGKNDEDHLRQLSADIKDKVEKNNIAVIRTRLMKTNEHPLASTVQAILGILGALGILILFLSSSLIANTLSSLLNQHLRFIGVMKLVGGRENQILGMYIVLILIFSLISLAIAIPLGGQGAYALSAFIADKLNFSLLYYRIIPLALLIQIIVGLGIPLLVGLNPIIKGSKIKIQRALSNDLVQTETSSNQVLEKQHPSETSLQGRINHFFSKRGIHFPRPMLIAFRNIFRRKGRLILTLFTLTMGGAIFIAVFNVRVTLHDYIDQIGKYFTADLTMDFNQPYRLDKVELEALKVPGVVRTEGWAFADGEALFPDGTTADNMIILAPPARSTLVSPILISGRWLQPGDEKSLTLSENILDKFPNLKPGESIHMKVNGKEDDWLVVGIFKFVDQEGTIAYSTYEYISHLTHLANKSYSFRVVTSSHDPAFQQLMSEKLDEHFRAQGYKLEEAQTGSATLKTASESLDILVTFLLIMAILTASVGSIGLTGTMSMNVMERTREIGIMRSIGAVDKVIMRMVILEGVVIGGISWLLGALLSFPITYMLASIVSQAVFNSPIDTKITWDGYLLWLIVVLVLSAIASILPARNAARLTIREVLSYE